MDIRNLGNFASIHAVWAAYPHGGIEGDYLFIPNSEGTKYRWNKYIRNWENAAVVTETPTRETRQVSDLEVQNDLLVGGNAKIRGNLTVEGLVNEGKGYDPEAFSGLGKVFLKKNIQNIDGVEKNVLVQEAFYKEDGTPNTNTIFVVSYNFDLNGDSVVVPENCILFFDGGSISNGTLIGNQTIIEAELINIFGANTEFSGAWNINEVYPEWFGAKVNEDVDNSNAINAAIFLATQIAGGVVKFSAGQYNFRQPIELLQKTLLFGSGIGVTILHQHDDWIVGDSDYDGAGIRSGVSVSCCVLKDFTITRTEHDDEHDADKKAGYGICIPDTDPSGSHPSIYGEGRQIAWKVGLYIDDYVPYKRVLIENVCVSQFHIGLYTGVGCFCSFISNSYFGESGKYGVYLLGTDSTIENCYINNNGEHGLIVGASNTKVSNIKSIFNGRKNPKNSSAIAVEGDRIQVTNCETQDNFCKGYYIGGHNNMIVNCLSNNDCYIGCVASLEDKAALDAYDTSLLVVGNIMRVLSDETHGSATTFYRFDGTSFNYLERNGLYGYVDDSYEPYGFLVRRREEQHIQNCVVCQYNNKYGSLYSQPVKNFVSGENTGIDFLDGFCVKTTNTASIFHDYTYYKDYSNPTHVIQGFGSVLMQSHSTMEGGSRVDNPVPYINLGSTGVIGIGEERSADSLTLFLSGKFKENVLDEKSSIIIASLMYDANTSFSLRLAKSYNIQDGYTYRFLSHLNREDYYKDTVATKAALDEYDTSNLENYDVIRVLSDEEHGGATTYYKWNAVNEYFTLDANIASVSPKIPASVFDNDDLITLCLTYKEGFLGIRGYWSGVDGHYFMITKEKCPPAVVSKFTKLILSSDFTYNKVIITNEEINDTHLLPGLNMQKFRSGAVVYESADNVNFPLNIVIDKNPTETAYAVLGLPNNLSKANPIPVTTLLDNASAFRSQGYISANAQDNATKNGFYQIQGTDISAVETDYGFLIVFALSDDVVYQKKIGFNVGATKERFKNGTWGNWT